MATVRIIITLKQGILDAAGQAVRQGLHALGYQNVSDVRVGRHIEITVPEGLSDQEIHAMCERFLANPLIEEWRYDVSPPGGRERLAAPPRTGRASSGSAKRAPGEIH